MSERLLDINWRVARKMLTKYRAFVYRRDARGRGMEFNITMILLAENKKRCPTRKDRRLDGRGRFVAHGAPFTIPIGYQAKRLYGLPLY